jgi:hypothetical protein
MKVNVLVLVIVAFILVPVSFGGEHPCWSEIEGTYINADYEGKKAAQVHIQRQGCRFKLLESIFSEISDKPILVVGRITDEGYYGEGIRAWISDDDYYYQGENESSRYEKDTPYYYYFILFRFSEDFIEAVWSVTDFPDEINPDDETYVIYYRIQY